jgi:hypothetical protein
VIPATRRGACAQRDRKTLEERNESTTLGETALRKVQSRAAARRGARYLRESKAQTETGITSPHFPNLSFRCSLSEEGKPGEE